MTRRLLFLPLLALAGHAPVAVAHAQEEPRVTHERRDDADPVRVEPLDVSLRLPPLHWRARREFLPQVTLTRLPPGSLVIRYAGLESVIVRRVQGRLRSLWHDTLEDAWEAGVLDDDEYSAQLDRMYGALADHRAGGRWWERSWLDSLVEARGGAPTAPFEHRVGSRVELRLGPLRVTNDLRAYVERVAVLTIDPDAARLLRDAEPARRAREHAWLVREAGDEDERPTTAEPADDDERARADAAPIVRATFAPPDPVLLRTRWRLTLRPSVSLRTSARPSEVVRDLRLRTSLDLYRGAAQLRFMTLELVVRYRPDADEVTVGVELVLVTW